MVRRPIVASADGPGQLMAAKTMQNWSSGPSAAAISVPSLLNLVPPQRDPSYGRHEWSRGIRDIHNNWSGTIRGTTSSYIPPPLYWALILSKDVLLMVNNYNSCRHRIQCVIYFQCLSALSVDSLSSLYDAPDMPIM